jgi:hypothetical protein
MSAPLIGFVFFIFVGMTAINRVLEGAFINSSDVAGLNQLSIFRSLDIGVFSLPVPNFEWVTGIAKLVKMDYAFFGGNAAFLQYLMYSVSGALMVVLGIIVIGLIYNYFRTR